MYISLCLKAFADLLYQISFMCSLNSITSLERTFNCNINVYSKCTDVWCYSMQQWILLSLLFAFYRWGSNICKILGSCKFAVDTLQSRHGVAGGLLRTHVPNSSLQLVWINSACYFRFEAEGNHVSLLLEMPIFSCRCILFQPSMQGEGSHRGLCFPESPT